MGYPNVHSWGRSGISAGMLSLILVLELLLALWVIIIPYPYSLIGVGPIVAVPILYIANVRPIYGAMFLIVLLPNYGLNFFAIVGQSEVSILEPAVAMALFCWVLYSIQEREIKFYRTSINVAVFLVFSWIALTLFWTPDIGRGVHHVIKIITGLLIYYSIINLTKDKKSFAMVAGTWIFLGVALSFYGVYETMVEGLSAISQLDINEGYTHLGRQVRTTSVIHGPDTLGLVLNLSIIITAVTLLTTSSGNTRAWLWVFIVVMSFTLLATFSRKSYLGVMLGMSYIVLNNKKGFRIFLYGVGVLTGLILMLYFVKPSFLDVVLNRVATFFQPFDVSITDRAKTWKIALELFSQTPIMGNGIGSFFTLAAMLDAPLSLVHNFYLFVLTELGLMGLFLIMFWVFQVVQNYIRFHRASRDKNAKTLATGMIAGLLALMVQAGFRTFGLTDPVFWGFLGLIVAFLKVYGIRTPSKKPSLVQQRKEIKA